MPERVVGIRFLARHFEADQGDDGGTRIGEVVEGVRGDCDGIAQDACQEFPGKEAEVQEDSHSSAQDAVSLSDGRILRIVLIPDKDPG